MLAKFSNIEQYLLDPPLVFKLKFGIWLSCLGQTRC
jgi:hypothetical protein